MAWVMVDDKFHETELALSLSHEAFRLYVCSITYCAGHKTDGNMSEMQVTALCRLHQIKEKRAVAELVEKGAWTQDGKGAIVKQEGMYYGDYPGKKTKDPTGAKRQQDYRERQKMYAGADAEPDSNAVTVPLRNGVTPESNGERNAVTPRARVGYPTLPVPPLPIPSLPVPVRPSPPGPERGVGETTSGDQTTDGRTDGFPPNGEGPVAEPLSAANCAGLTAEELLCRFQQSPFWADWGEHIADTLRRGKNRKSSEAVYVKPVIVRILAGTEPRPGSLQALVVSESRQERERAAATRVVTASKTKREINPNWLPGVEESEVRELLNDAVNRLPKGRPDDELVHLARKLWRTAHPDAPQASWEAQASKSAKRVATAESTPEDDAALRAEHQRKMERLRTQTEAAPTENETADVPAAEPEPQANNVRDILAAQFRPEEGLK